MPEDVPTAEPFAEKDARTRTRRLAQKDRDDLIRAFFGQADDCAHNMTPVYELVEYLLLRERVWAVQAAQRVLAGEDAVERARTAKGSSIALSYAMEGLDSLAEEYMADMSGRLYPPGRSEGGDDRG